MAIPRYSLSFRSLCGFCRIIVLGFVASFTFYIWYLVLQTWMNEEQPTKSTVPSVLLQRRYLPVGGADVRFDQPWKLAATDIIKNWSLLETGDRFILSDLSYRLGNLMFEFAALHFFAEKFNGTIVLSSKCLLRRAFVNLRRTKFMEDSALNGYILYLTEMGQKFHEYKGCCEYHPDLPLFQDGQNVEVIRGYYQSYSWFHPQFETEIRQSFVFLPEIQRRARELVTNSFKEATQMMENQTSTDIQFGHVSAPVDYFQSAIAKMKEKHKKVVFLVVGDNIEWTKRNLLPLASVGEIQFIKSGYREVDMAALSLCNHTVMSTGTFSWWTAYLTNGTTFYYGNWPKRGSVLWIMVSRAKVFLPQWQSVV
ncbi:L-Fucosyltransferase [Aphelenchoides besseyi]|nr:L-Fucosyltransferase [Aphelenchoides besseyi]